MEKKKTEKKNLHPEMAAAAHRFIRGEIRNRRVVQTDVVCIHAEYTPDLRAEHRAALGDFFAALLHGRTGLDQG